MMREATAVCSAISLIRAVCSTTSCTSGGQPPVGVGTEADPLDGRRAVADEGEHLLSGQREFDRSPAAHPGGHRGEDDVGVDERLGPETAADVRRDHPHLTGIEAEDRRRHERGRGRALGRVVQDQSAAVVATTVLAANTVPTPPDRDGRVRLHRVVVLHRRGVGLVDDDRARPRGRPRHRRRPSPPAGRGGPSPAYARRRCPPGARPRAAYSSYSARTRPAACRAISGVSAMTAPMIWPRKATSSDWRIQSSRSPSEASRGRVLVGEHVEHAADLATRLRRRWPAPGRGRWSTGRDARTPAARRSARTRTERCR